jgi:hypothetical protein
MVNWVTRALSWPVSALSTGEADASDFGATCRVARRMSIKKANQGATIVVVELHSQFNSKTGEYEDRRYNFYTYRGHGDFNDIENLKAAYVNGMRIDKADKASSSRVTTRQERVDFHAPREVSTARYRPVAWDESDLVGSKLMPASDVLAGDVADSGSDRASISGKNVVAEIPTARAESRFAILAR